ncbi:MAG: DUF998 domain-containing protein [Anaerolineaceae bacterium]|nr:DUF998 domain-containing protein [Anaerolineaceae bacterium]
MPQTIIDHTQKKLIKLNADLHQADELIRYRNLGILGLFSTALLGAAIFITSTAYSGLNGEKFSFANHFISELGKISVSEKGQLFNHALMIASLLLIPFFIGVGQFLNTILTRFASTLGIYTMVSINLIAIFNMDTPAHHKVAAIFFFSCSFLSMVFFFIGCFFQKTAPGRIPLEALWISMVTFVVDFTFLGSFIADWRNLNAVLFTPELFVRKTIWWMALTEWVMFAGILFWITAFSLKMIAYHRAVLERQRCYSWTREQVNHS